MLIFKCHFALDKDCEDNWAHSEESKPHTTLMQFNTQYCLLPPVTSCPITPSYLSWTDRYNLTIVFFFSCCWCLSNFQNKGPPFFLSSKVLFWWRLQRPTVKCTLSWMRMWVSLNVFSNLNINSSNKQTSSINATNRHVEHAVSYISASWGIQPPRVSFVFLLYFFLKV